MSRAALAVLAACLALPAAIGSAQPAGRLVYVGTYTRGESRGIYAFRFDAATGALAPLGLAAETPDPSFLALHPNGRVLYAVNETESFGGEKGTGGVSAFAIDEATGRLTLLNQQPSRGGAPCHVTVDRSGRVLLVANYSGGNVAAFPIASDGRLQPAASVVRHTGSSVNRERQQGPHAHSVDVDPSGRFVLAADLGIDRILVYRLDAARGTITPHDPASAPLPPGSGPRHLAFDPSGSRVHVINELTSTVTTMAWDAKAGTLTPGATVSTLPDGWQGRNSTAEIQAHPSGRFVYGSNRGHDSIAVFRAGGGGLAPAGHAFTRGRTPRNFALDPTGRWLIAANQQSDSLAVFAVDQETGALTPKGDVVATPVPVCVLWIS